MTKYHKTNTEIEAELVIIERAKKDPRAFRDLYNTYYAGIFQYIFKKVQDEEVTADITSYVFMKALNKIHSYTYKGFPFSAWLYKIASNEANQYFRKTNKTRTISIEEGGLHQLKDEVDEEDLFEEKRALLLNAIQLLNEDEIQLLELRFFEEKAFKEVAYILNITETNAKVKMYRLIEKIKKIVKEV